MAPTASRARSPIERLWERPLPSGRRAAWAVLAPAAMLYAGVLALRERWWRTRSEHASVPVISVGNLTVGGNGKTPFTLFLASRLAARGLAVGIVSRGWGRASRGSAPLLVADGNRCLSTPRDAGDEPVMMAKSFRGPIAVARRRIDAIRLLAARGHFDAFVLDDGFQHLRLHRDLNLLLINTARGFGNGWVLPAGPLREPAGAAARADAIVLLVSATDGAHDTGAGLPLPANVPVLHARLRPRALVQAEHGGWRELPLALGGRRVVAVSGLADPNGFHTMLRALGAVVIATLDFPDHHDYTPADFENLIAASGDADLVVTTEKDLVKLELFPETNVSLYALRLEVTMDADDEAHLFDLIARKVLVHRPLIAAHSIGRPLD